MRITPALAILLLFCAFQSQGQGNLYIDSLLNVEATTSNDSIKFQALNQLAIAYSDSAYEKSLLYWNKALALAKKKRSRPNMAHAYHQMGSMLMKKGEFPLALENFNNALTVHDFIHNKKGMGQIYNDIGLVYKTWGRYELALENYISALKLFDEIKDDEGLAMTSNNIGQIYYYRDEYTKSIEYFEKYLNVNKRKNNQRAVAGAANNIASAYLELADYDKALDYYLKSLRIYDSLGVKFGIAIIQDNIGTLYSKKQQYNDALLYHYNALALFRELNSKPRIGYVMMNIGLAHHKLNEHKKALQYLLDSKTISEELNQKENLKEIYFNLGNVYNALKDFEQALFYQKRFTHVKDSLMNLETAEKLSTMEARFEANRQSREMMLIKSRLERQKRLVLVFVTIGILFLFFMLLLVKENYQKKRNLSELKEQNITLHQSLLRFLSQREKAEFLLSKTFSDYFFLPIDFEKLSSNYLWVKQKGDFAILLMVSFAEGHDAINQKKAKTYSWFEETINDTLSPNPKNIVMGILEKSTSDSDLTTKPLTDSVNFNCLMYNPQKNSISYYGQHPCWLRTDDRMVRLPGAKSLENGTFHTINLLKDDIIFLLNMSTNTLLNASPDFSVEESIEKSLVTSINDSVSTQKELVTSTLEFWKNSYGPNYEALFLGITI